jgi:hypothetical protein
VWETDEGLLGIYGFLQQKPGTGSIKWWVDSAG